MFSTNSNISMITKDDDDDEVPMPGFRFHPTDEELVGFYLRRKVDKKSLNIDQLIKPIDIYKYDPWDLPKTTDLGDNESYFFCKRVKKYKNSLRPNRVTAGSGFWKVTDTDKPVFSHGENDGGDQGHCCIGLRKTLMYYRGRAGRGTKTEWMMHEFRLPNARYTIEEAEVWTLCRIMKRKFSYKKNSLGKRKLSSAASKACYVESDKLVSYSNDGAPIIQYQNNHENPTIYELNQLHLASAWNHQWGYQLPYLPSTSSFTNEDGNELFTNANWDELRSVVWHLS